MAKYSITMSDDLSGYVRETIKGRKFDHASEYFRYLVRRDMEEQNSTSELRALIDEGLKSGISDKSVDDIWAEAVRLETGVDA